MKLLMNFQKTSSQICQINFKSNQSNSNIYTDYTSVSNQKRFDEMIHMFDEDQIKKVNILTVNMY